MASFWQHLLFGYFALSEPLYSCRYWLYQKAQDKMTPPRRPVDKPRFYRQKTTIQWLKTLCVAISMGELGPLFYTPGRRLESNEAETWFLVMLVAGVFAWLLLEIVPSPWRAWRRAAILRDLGRLAHILPETRAERRWWGWVCVTAGVCEELTYRGFFIRYLHQPPFGLKPVSSLFFSSLAFGAIHSSQGVRGVLFAGIVGMMLCALFFLSGNLLLPIVVHALIDGRIVWIRYQTQDEIAKQ